MKRYTYSIEDGLLILANSMVDDPAVEESVDYFSKHNFQVEGNNVLGPAIIVDKPIFRISSEHPEGYEIIFTKEVADHLTQQLLHDGFQSVHLSLDHNGKPIDESKVSLTAVFQVSPLTPFRNLPAGSLILGYKILDPDLLEEFHKRGGFSIEVAYNKLLPLDPLQDALSYLRK